MRLKDKDSKMQGQIIKALAGFYYVESVVRFIKHARVEIFVKKVIPPMLEIG